MDGVEVKWRQQSRARLSSLLKSRPLGSAPVQELLFPINSAFFFNFFFLFLIFDDLMRCLKKNWTIQNT